MKIPRAHPAQRAGGRWEACLSGAAPHSSSSPGLCVSLPRLPVLTAAAEPLAWRPLCSLPRRPSSEAPLCSCPHVWVWLGCSLDKWLYVKAVMMLTDSVVIWWSSKLLPSAPSVEQLSSLAAGAEWDAGCGNKSGGRLLWQMRFPQLSPCAFLASASLCGVGWGLKCSPGRKDRGASTQKFRDTSYRNNLPGAGLSCFFLTNVFSSSIEFSCG